MSCTETPQHDCDGRLRRSSLLFHLLLLLIPIVLLASSSTYARESLVLRRSGSDPQTRAADTWLDEQNPATNNGTDASLSVRSLNTTRDRRSIILFDLSSIPAAGIKQATLTLNLNTVPSASRTYGVYRISSYWNESGASWTNRLILGPSTVAWGAAGGDVASLLTSQPTPASPGAMNFNISNSLQQWYSGLSPIYGNMIRDTTENAAGAGFTGAFSSHDDPVEANRPTLTIQLIQSVVGLTAVAGNATATLSWTYPAAVGTVLAQNNGVLILRQAGSPIANNPLPTDGTTPALCSAIGGATVVFVPPSNPGSPVTSFNDTAICGGLTNGTTYYYKVFARDTNTDYATSSIQEASPPLPSVAFVPEISVTPSATTPAGPVWVLPTAATTLAAPGLIPNWRLIVGSNNNFILGANTSNGFPPFPPIPTGGAVSGRPPIIESSDSSNGLNSAYITSQDDFLYGVNLASGAPFGIMNPTNLTTNNFQGAAAVVVKAFSGSGYTLTHDLVVAGTRNTGSTTTNRVVAVNPNTGATVWTMIGASGGNPNMDIINSTPLVDYINNAIWVTSNQSTTAPSLWKLNPNTGAVISSSNNGDIDSSPTTTPLGEFVFIGTNAGSVLAVNPSTLATVATATPAPTDGAVRGFPLVLGIISPWTVVFTTNGNVHAYSFNGTTFTFSWKTAVASPSAPVVTFFGANEKGYVGSSDGTIKQLNLATGAIESTRVVGGTVGDPTLDTVLSRVYAGSTNGRVFAFSIPF